ncbi:MAG: extracellular solute-binding protein [Ancrocorticia sp.]|jgi:N,N'-diacetylchitobiose transport system substrate-binding protein|nr:extracellular solute-binding protein [Ancrocorticia sp.]MCI1895735.1 extracellular solute-binding protein [Ancrocorticia sp.]MCI1933354.1 extracellular solute-binding protein [Ancrocorticia sp.]MCI1962998.1 extracellular solute-binding protein [Ancrocorticia sp.]MCI2001366.1 extracellular solute-binding protein [Ancrocorticia sp.]
MKRMRIAAAVATVSMLALGACSSGGSTGSATTGAATDSATIDKSANADKTITLWLAGSDTPDELREYLIKTFNEKTGATLKIEEQSWTDLVTKLTTALPDAENTPDVVEIGNTQAPTFTSVGAFLPLTDIYDELGGDDLLQSFVDAGTYDGTVYAVPYYFGSRYIFYRPDIWEAAGVEVPTTLQEFTDAATKLTTDTMSGFAMGGQDWRNGISWVFANGGELATVDGTTWTSTLSDPNTIKGLEMWQELVENASNLPTTERDVAYWDFLNDGTDGSAPAAASIMAPGWARWSIGDLTTNDDGDEVRDGMADDSKFDIFALPGVDGGVAPVFAGGSNIAISAKSQNPELAKELMKIIFSEDYQNMLGENGLGPANTKYTSSLGDDKFAKTMIETAENSKLTPAAPGWASIEGAYVYEELFQKIADGGDVTALAKEYDAKLTPMLNGN